MAEDALVQAVVERFLREYSYAPSGVFCAPGRVNLIGEHTDYNDGFVLPMAIAHRAYVAASVVSEPRVRVFSGQFGHSEWRLGSPETLSSGWWSYVVGAVAACRDIASEISGMDLVLHSEVPVGAGLSSSAAMECAVTLATLTLWGQSPEPALVAQTAHRAETEYVGIPCGIMDQTISACAQAGSAMLLDCRSQTAHHIPIQWSNAGLELVVIDTRAKHQLQTGAYAERRDTCHAVAHQLGRGSLRDVMVSDLTALSHPVSLSHDASLSAPWLRRARHVVTENERVQQFAQALVSGDYPTLGELMVQSHNSLRDDFEVSCPELDLAVKTATASGALGARMTGAGFGGSAIALVPRADVSRLRASMEREFLGHGFAAPVCFIVHPSAGACRIL